MESNEWVGWPALPADRDVLNDRYRAAKGLRVRWEKAIPQFLAPYKALDVPSFVIAFDDIKAAAAEGLRILGDRKELESLAAVRDELIHGPARREAKRRRRVREKLAARPQEDGEGPLKSLSTNGKPFRSPPALFLTAYQRLPGQFETFHVDPEVVALFPQPDYQQTRDLLDAARDNAELLQMRFVLWPTVVFLARELLEWPLRLRRRIDAGRHTERPRRPVGRPPSDEKAARDKLIRRISKETGKTTPAALWAVCQGRPEMSSYLPLTTSIVKRALEATKRKRKKSN